MLNTIKYTKDIIKHCRRRKTHPTSASYKFPLLHNWQLVGDGCQAPFFVETVEGLYSIYIFLCEYNSLKKSWYFKLTWVLFNRLRIKKKKGLLWFFVMFSFWYPVRHSRGKCIILQHALSYQARYFLKKRHQSWLDPEICEE